ncbi:hypothetical protein ACFCW2_13705 [Qipengyuania sp. DSG2-2]|uniref:hypothetical protein n=1 Tax=Qipengyuania sp. DGS2-2 TaxID=3349631 RepID=UPI0036D2E0FF
MRQTIALGLAVFVAADILVTLTYGLLWPNLYDWNIVDWDSETRFWIELLFHGLIAAVIGAFFCTWFARRIKKTFIQ